MRSGILLVAGLLAAAVVAEPVVSNVSLTPVAGTRNFRVTYDLSEDAIITFGAKASGTDLPGEQLRGLYGDVCRKVPAGTGRSFFWRAGDLRADDTAVEPIVTAWTDAAPPLYCAVDLAAGTNTTSYPFQYYPSAAAIPSGGTNLAWKTQWLLMRRIDPTGPQGFIMGTPDGEELKGLNESPHTVVLTNAFYMAVYETTQEQWVRVCHTWTTAKVHNDGHDSPLVDGGTPFVYRTRPADSMSQVEATDFAALLAARTGRAFRLPTEAQWEYACRAGTTGPFYVPGSTEAVANTIARNSANRTDPVRGLTAEDTARVGSYLPNDWGLYDMIGNVWEWCSDTFVADLGTASVTEPEGTGSGNGVIRGGSFWEPIKPRSNDGACCKCSSRYSFDKTSRSYNVGFRVSMNIQ